MVGFHKQVMPTNQIFTRLVICKPLNVVSDSDMSSCGNCIVLVAVSLLEVVTLPLLSALYYKYMGNG